MSKHDLPITVDEIRTLASSAIADIHGQVDEIFADGLQRTSRTDWTAATLGAKRDEIVRLLDRAIELCEALEDRGVDPQAPRSEERSP